MKALILIQIECFKTNIIAHYSTYNLIYFTLYIPTNLNHLFKSLTG